MIAHLRSGAHLVRVKRFTRYWQDPQFRAAVDREKARARLEGEQKGWITYAIHDPTTPNRQGADVGPQYRSIVLAHDDAQAETARAVIAELAAEGVWDAPIVTQVVPLDRFWPAEAPHQHYYVRNPRQAYCQVVVEPKVAKFRQKFAERRRTASR